MLESHLEEFVRIVEAGSVSAAARELGVPRASVSRRLARLEASYGVQLLHRDTHRQNLSEAGSQLYLRARRIVADLEEARSAVSQLDTVPRGLLRVGLPAGAGFEMLLARAYRKAYPEVELEFLSTHANDDLLDNRIDVALRAGRIEDEQLIGRKLLSFRNQVYCAPSLIDERGPPTLENLSSWDCLLGFDGYGRPKTQWPLSDGGTVPVRGPIRTNSGASRIEGALLGMGLILASERVCRSHVASGELVQVLEGVVGTSISVSLVWPATEFLPPKTRAFIDLASELIGTLARKRDAGQ